MYFNFYGFSERPFDVTPDPRFLYLSPGHREVLASLVYAITDRRGFITVIGEVGTGKTTLLRAFLDRLGEDTKVGFIFNTDITFEELLHMAVVDLGLSTSEESLTKVQAIARLNEFAIQQSTLGNKVAIIVDEAQNLDHRCMENLRLLSNLETRQHKLIQIILSGQPELDSKLKQPELRQLAQRISLKRYLSPLSEKETYDYIQHRLAIAGCKNKRIFSSRAKQMICEYSGGVPRKINILCDNAFLIGYGLQEKRIKGHIVEEAIKDLSCSPFDETGCDNSGIDETKIQTTMKNSDQRSGLHLSSTKDGRFLKESRNKPKTQPSITSNRSGPVMYIARVACLVLIVLILFGMTVSRQLNNESPKTYKIDQISSPAPPSTSLEPPSQGRTGTHSQVSVGSDLVLANTKKDIIESVDPASQQDSVESTKQQDRVKTKQPEVHVGILNRNDSTEIVQQQGPVEDVQPEEPVELVHQEVSMETIQPEADQLRDRTDSSNTQLVEQRGSWKSVTVKNGDIFSKLVADAYGRATLDRVDFVRTHNLHIEDVDKIEVGQIIHFPPLDSKMKNTEGRIHKTE